MNTAASASAYKYWRRISRTSADSTVSPDLTVLSLVRPVRRLRTFIRVNA